MSVKADHRFNEKSALFVEYLYNPSYYANYRLAWKGATAPLQGVSGAQPYTTANRIFAIGHTQTFSPTLINEFRAEYSRQNQIATPNPSSLVDNSGIESRISGLNFVTDKFFPVPLINLNQGYGSFGPQQWQNGIQGEDAYTVSDNVTKIIGTHTLKGGFMWRRDDNWYDESWGYYLNFNGSLTSDPVTGLGGNALAQFLTGAVNTGSGSGLFHYPYQINNYWGFFAQDDWRVNSKLSLNFGLRYDIFGWFRERSNYLANLNFGGQNPDVPYKLAIDYFATPSHPSSKVFPANKNSLGPRFNFAYSPDNGHKWVIRGGFDLIYSNGISAAFGDQNGAISGPGFSQQVVYQGDYTGQTPAFYLGQGAPNLGLYSLSTLKTNNEQFLGQGVQGFLKGTHDPYIEQWSLFVQRQLFSDSVIAGTYRLPFGRGRTFFSHNRLADAVIGGWSLTQNWNLQDGVPLTVTGPCNAVTCRTNLIGDPNAFTGTRTKQDRENQWLNANAFSAVFQSDPRVADCIGPHGL